MYCFKLRGLKPALCYVVPGMADGREQYASMLAPVAAMQNRPWHGMAWRGVLAQHRKLATCEDRRMTTSKHHGITESQHESSDFKTKQQQCTRTTSKQHNPYMHVCPRVPMYVCMYVCTHVCMSACVYIFVCAICLNVFGGPLIFIQRVAWSAVGQDPIQSKFAERKNLRDFVALSVIIITGTSTKSRRFHFLINGCHFMTKKLRHFERPLTEFFLKQGSKTQK